MRCRSFEERLAPAGQCRWTVRGGLVRYCTFTRTIEGYEKGKKATVLVAAGGVYEYGTPAAALNYVEPYLKSILGFIGVTDAKFITAGGAA